MPAHPEDDLLTPSLQAEDDAVGFDEPWNPWSLVVVTFFFGLPAGGTLLALNQKRLGLPDRTLPILAGVLAGTVAVFAGTLWLQGQLPANMGERGAGQVSRLVGRVVLCLIAMGIAAPQRKRFRLYENSGREGARLLALRPAGIIALAVLLQGALYGVLLQVLRF